MSNQREKDAKSPPPATPEKDASSPANDPFVAPTPEVSPPAALGADPTQILFDALVADRKRKHPDDHTKDPLPDEWGQNGRSDSRLAGLIILVSVGVLLVGALIWGFLRLAETIDTNPDQAAREKPESSLRTAPPPAPPAPPQRPAEPAPPPQASRPADPPADPPPPEQPYEEPPPQEPYHEPPPEEPGDEDAPPEDGHPGEPEIHPAPDGEPLGEPID